VLNEIEVTVALRILAIRYQLCENTHSRMRVDFIRKLSAGCVMTPYSMETDIRKARRIREDVPRLYDEVLQVVEEGDRDETT
jgi:hypothetical protein